MSPVTDHDARRQRPLGQRLSQRDKSFHEEQTNKQTNNVACSSFDTNVSNQHDPSFSTVDTVCTVLGRDATPVAATSTKVIVQCFCRYCVLVAIVNIPLVACEAQSNASLQSRARH